MQSFHITTCGLLILCGLLVPLSSSPINSAIFLIMAFCNSAFILFFFNVEFLSLIFIIIYVGAIAVLFLFVVMMLNIKITEQNILAYSITNKILFIFMLFYCLFLILSYAFDNTFSRDIALSINKDEIILFLDEIHNINIIGQVLFNYFNSCLLIAGMMLLISLMGAILLTLDFRTVKKGNLVLKQLSKTFNSIQYTNK